MFPQMGSVKQSGNDSAENTNIIPPAGQKGDM
jgi:hypothetical protein